MFSFNRMLNNFPTKALSSFCVVISCKKGLEIKVLAIEVNSVLKPLSSGSSAKFLIIVKIVCVFNVAANKAEVMVFSEIFSVVSSFILFSNFFNILSSNPLLASIVFHNCPAFL